MKKITFILFAMLACSWQSYAQDTCATATTLTPGSIQCDDTANYGDTIDDNNCLGSYDGGNDYLFTYTAVNTGEVLTLNLTSLSTWTGIAISDGCPESGGGNCLGSSTSSGSDESFVSDPLTAGTVYYIHISTFPTPQTADFCLESSVGLPPPPPNNVTCATATPIACGETINATSDGSTGTQEGSGCSMGDNGIWYTFTGTGGDMTVTSDASFDHEMAISTGTCGALVNVGCDDGSVGTEEFTFASTLDETYYVYIAHYLSGNTTTGAIDITLTCAVIPTCTEAVVDSAVVVEDCANSEFSIDVTFSSLGDLTFVSDGTTDWTLGNGAATYTFGPYPTGTPITLDALHSDVDCDFTIGTFDFNECPTIVDCTGAGVNDGFCYGNNDLFELLYTSSDPTSELTITFNAGTIEDNSFSGGTYDDLIIYDGVDNTGAVLYNSDDETSAVDLTGRSYTATSGSLFITFDSDGSNSCATGDQTAIDYTVECTAPPACTPAEFQEVLADENCANNEFFLEVFFINTNNAVSVSDGTNTFAIVADIAIAGPYPSGTSVTFDVVHDDADCDYSLGTFSFTCPPDNVSCATAAPITCGETINATSDGSTGTQEGSGCSMGDNGIWFTFTGTGGDMTVTSDASFDHEMAISTGTCGTLVNVGCDDGSVGTEEFTFASTLDETYYVYIAHYLSGNLTTGTIDVTLTCAVIPTCIPATFTLSNGGNICPNDGGFVINVDITDLGTATTVNILQDGNVVYAGVDGTASPYSIGGLTSATDYDITVEDAADDTCFETQAFSTDVCPPENDLPDGAVTLTVGDTLCESPVIASNVGATDSGEGDPSCGVFGYEGGDVWYKVVVPVTGELTVETSPAIDSNITDTTMEIYSGSSGNLVSVECDDDDGGGNFSLIELTGLNPGDVLLIRVWEYGDNIKGEFVICAWSPTTLGVDDNTFDGFSYFPNPVKDVLTLDSPRAIDKVEVFNMLGQRIVAVNSQDTIQNIDMSNLQTGAYIVKVSIGDQTKAIRVLKE